MSAISGFLSAQSQSSATKSAASTAAQATQYGIDAQLKMWEQTRAAFSPYLEAGKPGLEQLLDTLPSYVNDTLIPIAQSYGAYTPQALPNAGFYINPVTGQSMQYPTSQPTLAAQAQMQGQPAAQAQVAGATAQPTATAGAPQPTTVGQTLQFPSAPTTTPAASMPTVASQADLTAGGVLAPTVPTLNQGLNYQFNTDDPVYQQKLSEKNRQIDAFLAKQGLQGSSAGESFRQEQMNALLAEEEQRQYTRAVSERDYSTQVAAQQYGLEAQRGDVLYNRLYGQTGDVYNRQLQGTLLGNQQAQGMLGTQYSLAGDVYNTLYGAAGNLTNLGSSAAGMTGQAAVNTGWGVANTSWAGGQAAAGAQLAGGQIQAGLYQGLGQMPYNAYSIYQQSQQPQQPQQQYNYYNPSSYMNYGPMGGYAGAGTYGVTPGASAMWH